MEYIREEMDMKDVPLSSIASKITLNEIKDTDLITIKVTDENPETAAKIANLVGDRFAKLVCETNQKRTESTLEFIENQMKKEKENMEKLLGEYKSYLLQSRGPEEVKMELDANWKK